MKTYIYFIQNGLEGDIKIGFSLNPNERIKSLQTGSPSTHRILLVKEGTQKDEEGLHKKFKKFRTKGEWFEPNEEILIFIDQEKENKKNEKIVELETKVEHLTNKDQKIVKLETKVKHLTTEIDNLRNRFDDKKIITYPPYTSPQHTVYCSKVHSIKIREDKKKRIKSLQFGGMCDVDLNSQQNGVTLTWEIDVDDEDENRNLILLSKLFEFDEFVLKQNNQIVNDDFFEDESNKDSIFDFISSKKFPYLRYFVLKGSFYESYYPYGYTDPTDDEITENSCGFCPREVILFPDEEIEW